MAQGSRPVMDQPLPVFGLLAASDKLAPARGLVAGLAVSMTVWAAVAVSIWRNMH